jgi:hypothetical protein
VGVVASLEFAAAGEAVPVEGGGTLVALTAAGASREWREGSEHARAQWLSSSCRLLAGGAAVPPDAVGDAGGMAMCCSGASSRVTGINAVCTKRFKTGAASKGKAQGEYPKQAKIK